MEDQREDLDRRLRALSVKQRSELERRMRRRSDARVAAASSIRAETRAERSSSGNRYPLSFAQQRLWFLDHLEPGNSTYNMPSAMRLQAWIDPLLLKASINRIIARHAVLRTTFHELEGQVVQRVESVGKFELPFIDLSAWPQAQREAEAHRLARQEAGVPFYLTRGPLLRAKLIRLAPNDHVVLLVMHHIVSDGWSFELFFRELRLIYEALALGREPELPELKLQYHDYALDQRQALRGEKLDALLEFWKARVGDAPERLDLPRDGDSTRSRGLNGALYSFEIRRESVADLDRVCRAEGATRYMLCLAVFELLLYRYSRQNVFLLGTAVANRGSPELDALIGLFVNSLVLRADLSGQPSFSTILRRVRGDVLGAMEHQDLPFERLVEELRPERTLNENPLFQVMFVFHGFKAGEGVVSEGASETNGGTGTAKFDLAMMLESVDDRLVASIEYRTDLFEQQTIARMAEHYESLLAAALAGPERHIDELDLMQAGERSKVLAFGNRGEHGEDGPCLHEVLADQARLLGNRPALRRADEQVSYAELERYSSAFARRLIERGVGRGDRVALCFSPSFDMYVALLGVFKAGATCVPLDPGYPPDRLRYMLDDSGPCLVVTGARETSLFEDEPWQRLEFGGVEALMDGGQGTEPLRAVHPDDPAYIIYTSGSTGRPKGVLVPHRGLWNVGQQQVRSFGLDAERLILQFSSFSFDASIYELCMALHVGACLLLLPRCQDLESLKFDDPRDWKRLVAILPPSVVAAMGEPLPAGTMVFVGEALPDDVARRCLASGIEVFNGYGPTEVTIWSSVARITGARSRPDIGRPIEGISIYILDEHLEPVPIGVPGTLWIGGPAVATGYVARRALTAERFMPDLFSERPGARMYCSGDLGRYLADGSIDFLGRIDQQVKVRGFRIETGEVEAAIGAHPAVHSVLVDARGSGADTHLCAWVSGEGAAFTREELQRHVAARLPNYMMPSRWVLMERMPLNPNGKIDRAALPQPVFTGQDGASAAPQTEMQRNVARLFADVLDLGSTGVDDDFFRLGGHSLLAIRLLARLRTVFGVKVALRDFFSRPTVRFLADTVEQSAGQNDRQQVALAPVSRTLLSLPLSRLDDLRDLDLDRFFQRALLETVDEPDAEPRPPEPGSCYLLPASYSQQRVWFVEQLDSGTSFYNMPFAIPVQGAFDTERFAQALTGISRRHEALRTCFVEVEGQPLQVVHQVAAFDVPCVDLSGNAPAARTQRMQRLIAEEARLPFDLRRAPLLRAKVLRLSAWEYVVLLTMHHIVSDGWSMSLLLKELDAFYRGDQDHLPPVPLQFGDYALYERRSMEAGEMSAMLDYWKTRLAGIPATLDLPFDRPRPERRSVGGQQHTFELDIDLSRAVRALARDHGGTLFMVLSATFQVLLYRWSGERDIVIGSPGANRDRAEIEGIIGFFVNNLVLRARLDGRTSFSDLLGRLRESIPADFENQGFPFDRLVEELQPERSLNRNPIFQVMLVLQNIGQGNGSNAAAQPSEPPAGGQSANLNAGTGTAKFDLLLALGEAGERIGGVFEYDSDLFDPGSIASLAEQFECLLRAATADPGSRLDALPVISPTKRAEILEKWGRGSMPETAPLRSVALDIARQAELSPDSLAVSEGDDRLSYAELVDRAGRLAALLAAAGVERGQTVALCLERSLDLVVAALAVQWGGNVYALIDPCLPPEKAATILAEIDAHALVLHARSEDRAPEYAGPRIHLGEVGDVLEQGPRPRPPEKPNPASLACVCINLERGTTPQRTLISHKALAWSAGPGAELLFKDCRRVGQATAIFSTLIHVELWGALTRGLELHLLTTDPSMAPREFGEELRRSGADLLIAAPSSLRELLRERAAGLDGLLTLAVLGEPLRASMVADLLASRPAGRLLHGLDYMECAGLASLAELAPEESERSWVCVGTPLPGVRAYVLDALGNPVAPGVAGELFLSSESLSEGFYAQPARTAQRLLPDPFASTPGGRLLRTGDRVRWRSDGRLEAMGRMDRSVRLRGFRIEPEAIEDCLREHPQIRACAVCPWSFGADDERLIAYIATRGEAVPTTSELRRFVRARLPEHMVPVSYVQVDAIGLTADGSPDFAHLPAPDLDRPELQDAYVAPSGAVETTLHRIWRQVFGLARIGVRDNFFHLGGHSLLAARVMARAADSFGIELPLRRIFQSPTIASLAAFIEERLAQGGNQAAPALVAADRSGPMVLSFAQQRLWFLARLQPGSPFYNMPAAVFLSANLQPELLEAALQALCRRHEILRTRYLFVDGEPRQQIEADGRVRLEVEDLRDLSPQDARSSARESAAEEARRPFDLERGPVMRARLVCITDEESLLLVTMHHIAGDGLSLEILFRELNLIYTAKLQGVTAALPPLRIQYADYAQWQRSWLSGAVLETQSEFWRQRLGGAPALHSLPTDRPRPSAQSFRGRVHRFDIPRTLADRLDELGRERGATLFVTLLTAFKVLLVRFSGEDDIVVGSPVANRPRPELEPLIGLFVNTLVLRTELFGELRFTEAMERVRAVVLDAHAHQALPFEQVVELLQPERHLDRHPLFQISFVLQNPQRGASGRHAQAGTAEGQTFEDTADTARFDLTLAIVDTDEGLHAAFEYSTDLFDASTVETMARVLRTLLEQVVERPETRIEELALARAEHDSEWNATEVDYGEFRSIAALFEEQARATPQAVALVDDEGVWTYGRLRTRSGRIAHGLHRRGIGPGHAVGVCMRRSKELVAVLLGIMRAGAAYVPIDVDAPAQRTVQLVADAGLRVLIGETALGALSEPLSCPVLRPEDLFEEPMGRDARLPVSAACDPAYIIFTSGSTGRPKGCVNHHEGLRNRLLWMQEYFSLGAGDTVLQKTPYTFDVSVWEFFWPLCVGARLVVARPDGHKDPAYLADMAARHEVTCMHFVPSMLRLFLNNPHASKCRRLTRVICSGEALTPDLCQRFFEVLDADLYNLYGPTEASIDVSFHACEREASSSVIPIGRPIANTSMHVLDRAMRVLPVGVPGEIYLGGVGLAAGYVGQPGLSAECFVPDPFSTRAGARLYRSGDRGRRLPDGRIEYLGRVDQQVKLRGVRIELGDIESHLNAHPGVEQAAALVREIQPGDQRLAAFLVPSAATARPVAVPLDDGDGEPAPESVLPNGMAVHAFNRTEVEFLYREIFQQRRYLRHGIRIDRAECIVDVGAHVGMFTLFAATEAPRARILAFEPVPELARLLRRNAARYGVDVEIREQAVGAGRGEIEFTYFPRVSILSSRYPDTGQQRQLLEHYLQNTQEDAADLGPAELDDLLQASLESRQLRCALQPLSDSLRESGIERIDLLKIDAEKSELEVLQTIAPEHWPSIRQVVLEVHDEQGRVDAVVSLLRTQGFHVLVERNPELAGTELVEVYASREPLSEEPECEPLPPAAPPYHWCNSQALIDDVRNALHEVLPASMVPSEWFLLGSLPRTSSGKLDRRALLAGAAQRVDARGEYRAPRNRLEHLMSEIWVEVLELPRVGIDDDFFALGGHSLLAARAIARVRDALGVDLPVRAFFEFPTIAALVAHMDALDMPDGTRRPEAPAIGPADPGDADVDEMDDAEVTSMLEQLLRQEGRVAP